VPEPEDVVRETVHEILARRGADAVALTPGTHLFDDLEMDSLEVAELSVVLEETLGRDPYTEGLVPQTVGEILAFYATAPEGGVSA
jgi:acyl carrier protein